MPKRTYEKYAVASALATYLQGKGWSSITEVRRGFQSDVPVTVPAVSIYFLPSIFDELQMGRNKPAFQRRVQVDAYMETEERAESIGDDIGAFFDEETVSVVDPDTSSIIAHVRCFDSSSIIMDTLPPTMTDAKVKRWREVVKATLNVDYLND
jgi:hypothetical protein